MEGVPEILPSAGTSAGTRILSRSRGLVLERESFLVPEALTTPSPDARLPRRDSRHSSRAQRSRGFAMLTVLAILTLLVIFATAFIQTVRIELQTTENFKNSMVVGDVAKTGIESLRGEFSSQLHGRDGIPFTGDEIRPYVSLIDSWAIGKAGVIDPALPRTVYDVRPWLFNTQLLDEWQEDNRIVTIIHNGAVWEVAGTSVGLPFVARLGVDEDPEGDVSGDNEPGLEFVDDNLDGRFDQDPELPAYARDRNDDDEDGLVDEDGVDFRAQVLRETLDGGRVDSLQLGWDQDGDYTGIESSAGRLNVAIAGNTNGVDGRHTHHQGIHPSELDLETFLACMLGSVRGLQMAQNVILDRWGPDRGPGTNDADDFFEGGIGNNDSGISGIPQDDPNLVPGDQVDNDGDGLTDEEDEVYAGPLDLFSGDLIDNEGSNAALLTNESDDDGNGVRDDIREIDTPGAGIDDLPETRPSDPFGDDTPAAARANLQRIQGMDQQIGNAVGSPTVFQLLDRFVTVKSTADRQLQETNLDPKGNRKKLNPNLILQQTPRASRRSVSYLLPLAGLDNDGDWGANSLDAAGAVIRDDSNSNQIPDGDWDGGAEVTSGESANSIDEDYDGKVDDDGDSNGDGIVTYDPESGVDEDRPTYGGLSIQDRGDVVARYDDIRGDLVDNNSNRERWMSDGIDNDGDGLTDETFVEDANQVDEGVDEPGEFYVRAWDEEMVDDGVPERVGNFSYYRMDEDPIDIQFVANLADSLDFSSDREWNDGATKVEIRNASKNYVVEAWGNEAVRITEVMARPLIRLQAEDAFSSTGWDLDQGSKECKGRHFIPEGATKGTWTFRDIPKGEYYVLVYSWGRNVENGSLPDIEYNLGRSSEIRVTGSPLFIADRDNETATDILFPSSNIREEGFLDANRPRLFYSEDLVEVDGEMVLEVENNAGEPDLSFDYVELYAPQAQYLEVANFGERSIDLTGWEIRVGSRITRIDEDAPDTDLEPGQFAVFHSVETQDDIDDGPSGIAILKAENYEGDADEVGTNPLEFTHADIIDSGSGSDPLTLTESLEEILFGPDGANAVELWAPVTTTVSDATMVLVDTFYFNGTSDFCTPSEVFRRQDNYSFASQHRGDPTVSLLRHDESDLNPGETIERYVHGPQRFLAADAAVTIDTQSESDPANVGAYVQDAAGFKAAAIVGTAVESDSEIKDSTKTEYGELLFEISERVRDQALVQDEFNFNENDFPEFTFHWPGILNQFRDPDGDLPVLHIRAGGVSNRPIGIVDFNPMAGDDEKDERFAFHGDLLYVVDPDPSKSAEFADVLDLDTDSLRVTVRLPDEEADLPGDATFELAVFGYIEVSPGLTGGSRHIAGDPGREHFYFPDPSLTVDNSSRSLYMDRLRGKPDGLQRNSRSLRFREGRMANCSPYQAGTNGRNIEKFSMGRGVFSGPTAQEFKQIATRMEFLGDPRVDGLLNVNVADQKVLCALPFFPPESRTFQDVNLRLRLAALMSQVLVMGRSQRGFDGEIGAIGEDDDGDGKADLEDFGGLGNTQGYIPRWDSSPNPRSGGGFHGFGHYGIDDDEDGLTDDPGEYKAPASDDGPYACVGEIANAILHPIVLDAILRHSGVDEEDLKPQGWASLADDLKPDLDETDLFAMMGRIMNLITVQSNEFTVISRGRVIDNANVEVLAEQKLEEELAAR